MRTNEISISFMKRGSAVVVGPKNEEDAISLYKDLLGNMAWPKARELSMHVKNYLIRKRISVNKSTTL